jgi:hypothetical protein
MESCSTGRRRPPDNVPTVAVSASTVRGLSPDLVSRLTPTLMRPPAEMPWPSSINCPAARNDPAYCGQPWWSAPVLKITLRVFELVGATGFEPVTPRL